MRGLGRQFVKLQGRQQAYRRAGRDARDFRKAPGGGWLRSRQCVEAAPGPDQITTVPQTPEIDGGHACGYEISRAGKAALARDFESPRHDWRICHAAICCIFHVIVNKYIGFATCRLQPAAEGLQFALQRGGHAACGMAAPARGVGHLGAAEHIVNKF